MLFANGNIILSRSNFSPEVFLFQKNLQTRFWYGKIFFMEMDKQTEKHILNILRQGTITWHVKNEVLKRNRRRKVVGNFKNGKIKEVWERQCDGDCKKWYELREDMFEIDHIDPVGSFNGNFDVHIRRLYCDIENLQALCFSCHKAKTANESANNVYERKQVFQEEEIVEDSHDNISYLDVL